MVFSHACIPLTVNLREERASTTWPRRQDQEFNRILDSVYWSLKDPSLIADSRLDEAWDHDYSNLFEVRWGKNLFPDCTLEQQIAILRYRTYWYSRLQPNTRELMNRLLSTGKKGVLQLKEILHTTDGMMASLIISFPEVLKSDVPTRAYINSDRIINNFISNALFDYAGLQKRWKNFKKELRKAAFLKEEYHPTDLEIRSMSWVMDVVHVYNSMASDSSKSKMFRICAFTQTRATGLANSKMVDATIQDFLDEVTTIKEYEPNKWLEEAIEAVTDRISVEAGGPTTNFRISMSTSSCTESSRKKDGKFGYLTSLVKNQIIPPVPDFNANNDGGQLGNWAFAEARKKVQSGSLDIWKTNVAGIRENGKVRVVTSGSFYKDALLQPFSHLTIEMLKCDPLLRDSLQSGRLGYKFIEGITHLDSARGELLFEEDVYAMSFDFSKATDRPSHKSAHATMGPLLRKMRVPPDVIDDIFRIWPGQKDLYVKGKFVGVQVNGIPMGDPLTKTNLSLAHPICCEYANRRVGQVVRGAGAGNGDDGIELRFGPHAKEWFGYFVEGASLLGYDLSELDHFITRDWATYCEEVFMIPIDRFNTVANAIRMKDDRLMPYLDVPKIRLVIDTKKDRWDYSSDTKGKYTLLGKDLEYAGRGGLKGCEHLFSVTSAMQDICLGLKYEKVPVYLPRQIFSIGKMPNSWNVGTWHNAVMVQRPHCRNVVYTVLREFNGKRKKMLSNLRGVLTSSSHFESESFVEIKSIPEDDPIRKYVCVHKEDFKKFPEGILDRLRETGRLVSERRVQAYYLFQQRIHEMNGGRTPGVDLFEVIKGMSIDLETPTSESLKAEMTTFRAKYFNSPWLLQSQIEEDLYPKEILEVLAKANPLRVDIDKFDYLKRFVKRSPADSPFERAVNQLEDWFDNNYEAVIAGEFFELPPTTVINDDPVLVLSVDRSETKINIIATNDLALVKLISNKCPSKAIGRISIEDWVNQDAMDSAILDPLGKKFPGVSASIHVDNGAFETFLLKTDIEPTKYPGWNDNVQRSEIRSQADVYDVYLPPKILTEETVLSIVKIDSRNLRLIAEFAST